MGAKRRLSLFEKAPRPEGHGRGPSRRRANVCALDIGADYTDEEREFLHAMDDYITRTGRRFPAWTEALGVLKSLGYRKPGDVE